MHAKDVSGNSPLHAAAVNENAEAAVAATQALVAAGSDMQAENLSGRTPLYLASRKPYSPPRAVAAACLLTAGPTDAGLRAEG